MSQLLLFLAATLGGILAGWGTNFNPVSTTAFHIGATAALVVGLYGSVVGIDLAAVRPHKWLALIIITVAVPAQILATGAIMYLIYPVGASFLLAAAIDQIDPLSTSTLLQDKEKMSAGAKGLLRIWASFDDPVTVICGFLILLPLVTGQAAGLDENRSYGLGLALNLAPAGLLWLLYRYTPLLRQRGASLVALLICLGYAFVTESYLFAAITGLLLRPIPEKYLQRAITGMYYVIVVIVGMALYSYRADLAEGVRLGALLALVEFFVVQPLTALILFNGSTRDVFRLAFAQQNGLTTLLMGLAFESYGVHVLHILLPAIIVVNLCNLCVNKLYSWKEKRGLIY